MQDLLLSQNSNSAVTQQQTLPSIHNKEQAIQSDPSKQETRQRKIYPKLPLQHVNSQEEMLVASSRSSIMLQKQHREGKDRKKQTFGGEACIQDQNNQNNRDGFFTSRSIPLERSFSKLTSNYLQENLKEQQEMLKKIEEQALRLKKEKKQRQKMKQIKKGIAEQSLNLTVSLAVVPANKHKFSHKRGQSCDFPLTQMQSSADFNQSLDEVNSEQEEESLTNSVINRQITSINAKELQKEQLQTLNHRNEGQISIKNTQINHLNSIIHSQTLKLQQIESLYESIRKKQEKNRIQIQKLQRQLKEKSQQQQQTKRRMEKEVAQMAEDRRKAEQSYLKEIQALNQKVQSQRIDQKRISDNLTHRQKQLTKQIQEMQQFLKKQNQLHTESIQKLKNEIVQLNETVMKLTASNQQKENARKTLQQYLCNAEEHIRKVEQKYHIVNKQLTQKNVSYDFLWIQLKEEEQRKRQNQRRNSQNVENHASLLNSSENESPMKQQEKCLNHILSSSTLKNIKDIMEQGEASGNPQQNPSEQQIKMHLPLCHKPSLNLRLLSSSRNSVDVEVDAVLQQVQSSSKNILLKNELSQAFSQENDQIDEMISNHNSSTSKMQSSLGAFSEYSRAKSTQSALTHKQIQQEYSNKMKTNKMLAKFGKLKPKK